MGNGPSRPSNSPRSGEIDRCSKELDIRHLANNGRFTPGGCMDGASCWANELIRYRLLFGRIKRLSAGAPMSSQLAFAVVTLVDVRGLRRTSL
jgi:hypothetical protein